MKPKTMMAALLGLGLAVNGLPLFAQEEAQATDNGADVAQQVTDAGVAAVNEAQEAGPIEQEEQQDAVSVLQKLMEKKGWAEGWDPEKKRFIAIGSAQFKSANPAEQKDLQKERRFAAKEASLIAKGLIITFIRQEMEAADQIVTPGTDLNKAMNAEVETLMEDVARQREVLADLLSQKDKAAAEELRGTTFGDRLNDLMAAAIKKLDADYDANARDKAAAAKYKAAVEKYNAEKAHFDELVKKAESLRGSVTETQQSVVKSMAAMPLFGATVMLQTESWDPDGTYKVAVMMVWSNVLERAARAIVNGENFTAKPSPNGKTVQEWLKTQDLSCMVGARQYIDKFGNRWFLGVAAEPAGRNLHPRVRNANEQRARLFANQEAIYCVSADVKTQEAAADMMQEREAGTTADGEQDFARTTAGTFARHLEQKTKMTIRGGQVLLRKTVKHPISGQDIYVVVYGYNPLSVGPALAAYTRNYATKVEFERQQTVERGRQAAANAAVEAAKNRPEDFKKGFNEQTGGIVNELQQRKPQPKGVRVQNSGSNTQKAAAPAKASSGTFGGDVDVGDDF